MKLGSYNLSLCLDILLTEHISNRYSIVFTLHHIGKCIMPFIVFTKLSNDKNNLG